MTKLTYFLWVVIVGGMVTNAMAGASEQCAAAPVKQSESTEGLRAEGPGGLVEALKPLDDLQAKLVELQKESERLTLDGWDKNQEAILRIQRQTSEVSSQMDVLRKSIDQVGGQRGCSVSRLYWYTDLAEAKAAAEKTGRPILSLRMLGKLTDEFSCANSRFFRTALYSNKEVSDFLRTNFVLHWQSVRPVPRVTIDFGDGRKLERTITGNSAHYVLAADGTPIDVLPGLYSPAAFRQHLWDASNFCGRYTAAPLSERGTLLRAYHHDKANDALQQWDIDIQRLGDQQAEIISTRIKTALEFARLSGAPAPAHGPAPKAAMASRQAKGKLAVEAPMFRFAKLGGTWIERGMDDDVWQAIANLHREDVKLDEASVAVVRKEFPAAMAMRAAVSKRRQEDPVLRMVRTFEDSIALDTVRNEYLLHRRIHEKFAAKDAVTTDFDVLNEWVYAELFLTPSSDPWLGLAPNDIYTALENDGQTAPVAERSGG